MRGSAVIAAAVLAMSSWIASADACSPLSNQGFGAVRAEGTDGFRLVSAVVCGRVDESRKLFANGGSELEVRGGHIRAPLLARRFAMKKPVMRVVKEAPVPTVVVGVGDNAIHGLLGTRLTKVGESNLDSMLALVTYAMYDFEDATGRLFSLPVRPRMTPTRYALGGEQARKDPKATLYAGNGAVTKSRFDRGYYRQVPAAIEAGIPTIPTTPTIPAHHDRPVAAPEPEPGSDPLPGSEWSDREIMLAKKGAVEPVTEAQTLDRIEEPAPKVVEPAVQLAAEEVVEEVPESIAAIAPAAGPETTKRVSRGIRWFISNSAWTHYLRGRDGSR